MKNSSVLCSNGTNNREILCLISVLCLTCIMSTFVHMTGYTLPSVRFTREAVSYEEWLVKWHPSYNDSNVYYLQDTPAGTTFVFNPTVFTGVEFYVKLMKKFIIQTGHTDVKIFDLTGIKEESESLERQTRLLTKFLFDSGQSNSYIISQAHVSDIFGQASFDDDSQLPFPCRSVSFIRHPFESFVASFYYHRHGKKLFSSDNKESKKQFLHKLNQVVDEVEKYVEAGNDIRTYANDMSAVVPFCGWTNSKCLGVHKARAERVITWAQKNAKFSNTFIGLMEDFNAIPDLLEKLSPGIFTGLSQYAKSHAASFPPWLNTEIHLKHKVQDILKKDNRLKIELRFYTWVQEQYYREKKRLLTPRS